MAYNTSKLPAGRYETNLCVTARGSVLAVGALDPERGDTGPQRPARGRSSRSMSILTVPVFRSTDWGETWTKTVIKLGAGKGMPLVQECELAAHPSGRVALTASLGASGFSFISQDDGLGFTEKTMHPVPHETRRPKMSTGTRPDGSMRFLKATGAQPAPASTSVQSIGPERVPESLMLEALFFESSDGLRWTRLGPAIAPLEGEPGAAPPQSGAAPSARFAQNAYNMVLHPRGGFLLVRGRYLYFSPDGKTWGAWRPRGLDITWPKDIVWDEAGTLYVVGSTKYGRDAGLVFQASPDGGKEFGAAWPVFDGDLDSEGSQYGEAVIAGPRGVLHFAFASKEADGKGRLRHVVAEDAHARPTFHRAEPDPDHGAGRMDFVRIALGHGGKAVIGWGDENGAYVVSEL